MTLKRMVSLDGHLFAPDVNDDGVAVAHAFVPNGVLVPPALCGATLDWRAVAAWRQKVYAEEACEDCLNEFTARQLAAHNQEKV